MTHPELVRSITKPGWQIQAELNEWDCNLWHMATGLSGEAGEVLDCVKRRVVYRKDLDHENLMEELGDIEFFLEGIRQAVGVTREQCLEHNVAKLSKRYSSGSFSNDEAQLRADKTLSPPTHSD